MNRRKTIANFPPQLTMLAAAMLAGLGVVASIDAGPASPFAMLAVVDAPDGVEAAAATKRP